MSQVAGGSLAAGREAIVRHDWSEAYERLREADAESPLGPEDLERLAEAAWWTAKLDECIAARERAFALYHGEGTRRAAALVAISLAKDYYAKGSSSIGAAWVNRAERLLADEPDCVEQGRLHRLRGVIALEVQDNYEVALEEARLARETAARFHDADLLALALHDEGRALVMRGDVDAGMALIDEATAPATAGELTPFNTAVIYCNTITACKELADYRRAGEWSEAAKRWCERQAIAGFPGMCRVYRASIMALRGAWSEAEVEARLACEELPSFNRGYAAEAFYELGEIRLRSGDLPAAEEAFTHAHELGRDPQPGLARLRLVQGRIGGASTSLSRALDAEPGELHRARLLSAQVEVALTAGSAEAARAASDELAAIAARYGSDALAAAAADGRARVGLAAGEAQAAGRAAREAVRLWQAVEAPYETAQARVVLGRIHASDGDDENARLELAAAAATFERLGARLDARGARDELARLRTGAGAPDGDARAMRTFLVSDIVRSTSLVEALGDEAWTDLVAWHDKTLRSLFAEHEGEEVDHAGDGFFVAFAAPRQALACAIAIQRRLAEQRREHGFAPQVRIGVHATEAVRHGNGYTGRGVHAAARIGALAGGAEILASRSTVDAAGLEEATQQTRTVALKGIEEPVEVVTLDWS